MTTHVEGPIAVVDSHTEGEPTRVVLSGWPVPPGATVVARRDRLQAEHDAIRRAVILEPRGHEAMVGALLVPAERPEAETGVIFFNDVGWLGMCGHGTIGVVRTLQYLGRIGPGAVELDTPVGPVGAELHADESVTVRNVPARLHLSDIAVEVPGIGRVRGDVAWGGNWFFLTEIPELPLEYARRAELLRAAIAIRAALAEQGITGDGGAVIDHIELFGPPQRDDADARNFVLCPGTSYDRSPCGTGTSAKLAVLHAKGELAVGEQWRQESIIGSRFVGWLADHRGTLLPHVRGTAHVTATATLHFDARDPFRDGIE